MERYVHREMGMCMFSLGLSCSLIYQTLLSEQKLTVTKEQVQEQLKAVTMKADVSRYIL
jgi:hypothetical protein